MDSKDYLDNGAEFIVITQTLTDLCDRVCALNDSNQLSASIGRDGQKLPNVLGEVNLMVTNDHGCSVDSGCTKIIDGARCGDMEHNDETRNNLSGGVNDVGIDHHQNNNQNKLCSDCNKSFPKGQHTSPRPRQLEVGDGMKNNGVKLNEINLSMNGLAESANMPSISDGCAGTMVSHIVGSEVEADNELKTKDSAESSSTCLHSNSVAMDQIYCQKIPSNKYKGTCTVELVEGNLSDCNENMEDSQSEITRKVGKEVVSKTSNDSKESSLISGSDPATVVDDFTFVLNVVKKDLEQMQVLNEMVTSTSQDKDLNQDCFKKESESNEDSSSSSSDSSSSDETDSECEDTPKNFRKMQTFITEEEGKITHDGPPKTKDEVLFSELPPPPTMDIRLDDVQEIKPLGEIESILNEDAVVIIKSFPDVPAIDSESVLFLEDGSGFGEVFEIFGQVKNPHYCVRFNSKDEIEARQLSVGQTVFYAPSKEALTHFVFVSRLGSKKGSDASWRHDQEPPEAILDYSDDEAESKAKTAKRREHRMKNRGENQPQEKVSSDAPKNVTKQRPSNQATKRLQSSRRNQANHPQLHHTAPPRPFNSWPRNQQSNSYGGRFPQEQNLPLQFNPMVPMQWSPPPRYPYHQHQFCQSYSKVPQHLQHPPPPPPAPAAEFIGQHPLIAQNADNMFNHHGQPDPCNFRPLPQNMVPPPPSQNMVPLPPQNMVPPPPQNMVPPPPQNMIPQQPQNIMLAPPPSQNMVPPPQNMVPIPPQNMVPPQPPQNMVPIPPQNIMVPPHQNVGRPPSQNMVPPHPQNMVPPPPQNMVPPPPQNMVPPPPQNMVPPPPQNMVPPHPQNMVPPPPQNMVPPHPQNMVPPHPQNMVPPPPQHMVPPHQNVGLPVDQPGLPEQFAHPNGHFVNQGQFMSRPGWFIVPPQIRPQVPENGPVVSGNTVIITVINQND